LTLSHHNPCIYVSIFIDVDERVNEKWLVLPNINWHDWFSRIWLNRTCYIVQLISHAQQRRNLLSLWNCADSSCRIGRRYLDWERSTRHDAARFCITVTKTELSRDDRLKRLFQWFRECRIVNYRYISNRYVERTSTVPVRPNAITKLVHFWVDDYVNSQLIKRETSRKFEMFSKFYVHQMYRYLIRSGRPASLSSQRSR